MIYFELHARSAFSFLRGASNPEDLACAAARLNLPAIAMCDRDGVYGSPRLHAAANEQGIHAFVGVELTMEDKCILPVLVANRTGYQNLCRLVTNARLRGSKTASTVLWQELPAYTEGLIALTGDEEGILQDPCHPQTPKRLEQLTTAFGKGNVFVEIQGHLRRGETWRNQQLVALARAHKLPLVATNGVLYAQPDARRALDLFTCVRNHTTFDSAGRLLSINAERYLKSAAQMARLFADLPEAIENTAKIA
ncbi:MAG TPA: PHP domain-containing protein, partial [Terrimicrobiaceae bacterium]|nr:PHP domain-containing protein [Terrimicrobiaceae bacterium]